MLYIKELENNTIDLNTNEAYYEFTVISKDANNRNKTYSIDLVSNDAILVKKYDTILSIEIDIESILKEEYIILSNTLDERIRITILPSTYQIMDKNYKFKITKRTYNEDGSIKVKILSTVNDMELGWRCSYDGKPMSYSISPMSNDEGCYVTITQAATVVSEFDSLIKFTQDESGNEIKLVLHNTPEGIKKKVD